MKIKKFTLNNLLLYLIITLSLTLAQGFSFVSQHEMNYLELFISFGAIVLLSCLYFYIERKNKFKIYPLLIGLLGIVAIGSIISTCLLPSSYQFGIENVKGEYISYFATLENSTKVLNVFSIISFLYCIYLFVGVMPQKICSVKQLKLIFYAIIIFTFVAVIFSFIKDAQSYANLFQGNESSRIEIISFTNNANNYAGIIFFGIVASIYLHYITSNHLFYIPVGIFLISIFPTLSRTFIVSAVALVFFYLILRAVFEFKNHKLKVILTGSIILSICLSIGISYGVCVSNNVAKDFPPFEVLNLLFERFARGLNGREDVWRQTTCLINTSHSWAFGMGFRVFDTLFYNLQYSAYAEYAISSPDNGFLQVIIDGGIALALVICFLIVLTIIASIKIYKKHKKLFYLNLLLLLVFLFEMGFESAAILAPGVTIINYCFMSMISFVPVLSTYHNEKNEINEIVVEPIYKEEKEEVYGKIAKATAFILTLGYIVTISLLTLYKSNIGVFILFMIFAHAFILVPLIIELINFKKVNWKKYLFNIFIPYVSSAIICTSIVHLFACIFTINDYILLVLILFVSMLYIFLFLSINYLQNSLGYISDFIYLIRKIIYKFCFHKNKKRPSLEDDLFIE